VWDSDLGWESAHAHTCTNTRTHTHTHSVGNTKDAIKIMENIVKKRQGYTDMHVALAAVAWGQGDRCKLVHMISLLAPALPS